MRRPAAPGIGGCLANLSTVCGKLDEISKIMRDCRAQSSVTLWCRGSILKTTFSSIKKHFAKDHHLKTTSISICNLERRQSIHYTMFQSQTTLKSSSSEFTLTGRTTKLNLSLKHFTQPWF